MFTLLLFLATLIVGFLLGRQYERRSRSHDSRRQPHPHAHVDTTARRRRSGETHGTRHSRVLNLDVGVVAIIQEHGSRGHLQPPPPYTLSNAAVVPSASPAVNQTPPDGPAYALTGAWGALGEVTIRSTAGVKGHLGQLPPKFAGLATPDARSSIVMNSVGYQYQNERKPRSDEENTGDGDDDDGEVTD
ncbi:hypothetical protein M413DRAFT_26093 [Hebeloma cylindrosporum]|uniref:Uncharacterized protein n=1 Tax=Hebeloma cylindrosporum TaxID=76867 RepID=A0A0C2YRY7_HEBCY|nr:hypothetical protein M413DRAFT_26093 [Hebeloma cylindrosporum h7]